MCLGRYTKGQTSWKANPDDNNNLKKMNREKEQNHFSTFSLRYRIQRTNMVSKLTDYQLPTIQLNKTISYKILINHARRRSREKNKEVRTNPPPSVWRQNRWGLIVPLDPENKDGWYFRQEVINTWYNKRKPGETTWEPK